MKLGSSANIDQDTKENVVEAFVEFDEGNLSREQRESELGLYFHAGTEVRAKVDCGPEKLHFVLLHDLYEFAVSMWFSIW